MAHRSSLLRALLALLVLTATSACSDQANTPATETTSTRAADSPTTDKAAAATPALVAATPMAAAGGTAASPVPATPVAAATTLAAGMAVADDQPTRVLFDTSMGAMVVELFPEDAPATTANFLAYVDDGFYDGLVFHRVIDNFMIQGGGYDADLEHRQPGDPVENEADNGLKNVRGTLAMARMADPDSADSQFFINLKANTHLDWQQRLNPGYTVFAKVVAGMDVVERIAMVETGDSKGMANVPLQPIVIRSARRHSGGLPGS